ncbi:hypothetical protein Tco_0900400 [Tanacetum coccineum]
MELLEIMKISSFMDSLKCPELANCFSDKAPTTVNEMMKRLYDFVRSEKAFAQMEKPPEGENGSQARKVNNNRGRDNRPPYPAQRGDHQTQVTPVLTLDALTKGPIPKEILATETQLRLAPSRPMIHPNRGGNMDRFCDYHQEKGHHINDCHHLRRQLEAALESGKLNHIINDVRQRGRWNQRGHGPQQEKIINMVGIKNLKEKKRKRQEVTEKWMDTPITFPLISTEDVLDEALIVEAEVEGYLVRRIYVDRGASVEIMFEHYFENLSPAIKARLKETQTDLVGFAREETKPLGTIEMEDGLTLRHSFPIHSMMNFPATPENATLLTRSVIISECRRLEKKQVVEKESVGNPIPPSLHNMNKKLRKKIKKEF